MKKVIVTGGAGYIGSHTVVELWKAGYTPIIIDNLSNTTIDNIKGIESIIGTDIEYHKVDCTCRTSLYDVFKNIESDNDASSFADEIIGVIHFAAFKSVGESVEKPDKYYSNNIGSMKSIMDVMDTLDISNLIFSSSCSVYGNADILPVSEEAPFKDPESPYAETKQICESILDESDIDSISLRYFNPIGSHQSGHIGDRSTDKPAAIVPVITNKVLNNGELTVFGKDYNTKDGTCVRDYIHVVDLAKAHVKSLKHLESKSGKYVYNIGTGKGTSVLEAINTFENATGEKINWKYGDKREGDVVEVYADCTKVEKELGWKSEKSLENCMIDSWNWERHK